MLVTVILPFCDFRPLLDPAFRALDRPRWPSPPDGHMRGIGGVRRRYLRGFPDWVGEDSLVAGVPAIRLQLPRTLPGIPPFRVRLIRKSCHFDGMLGGRFEFLVRLDPDVVDREQAVHAALALLELPVRVPRLYGQEALPLRKAGAAGAWLWARARLRKAETQFKHVRAGRPFVVVENGANLGDVAAQEVGTQLILRGDPAPHELFLLYPRPGAATGARSPFRNAARTMRTYLLRLLQDVETISQICALADEVFDQDRVQFYVNEYTRHIMRSADKADGADDAIIAYCYAAFDRLYPGKIDGLRHQIIASPMRRQVKDKLLALLDHVTLANQTIVNIYNGDHVEGDKTEMRDKYENVTVSGQGNAVGSGNSTNVSGSINQPMNAELITALKALSDKVRESDHKDADGEAECIDAAVKKAEAGDEKGVLFHLKKVGSWALDLATEIGKPILSTYLKTQLGVP